MIDAKPTENPLVRVSVARQRQIIDTINRGLLANPLQGFCLMGKPGTGKTYLMKSIMRTVADRACLLHHPMGDLKSDPCVARLTTLADWQEDNLARSRSGRGDEKEPISSTTIRAIAAENARRSRFYFDDPRYVFPFTIAHYFLDEFDSQPTVSEFSTSKLQTFINSCYDNALRIGTGNSQAFVQLVIAMNKSWDEFTSSYGLHVARRIAEMCKRIDFDRGVVTEPAAPPPAPAVTPDLAEDKWFAEEPSQGSNMVGSKRNRVEEYEAEAVEECDVDTVNDTEDQTVD
jgi:hypothetical protein